MGLLKLSTGRGALVWFLLVLFWSGNAAGAYHPDGWTAIEIRNKGSVDLYVASARRHDEWMKYHWTYKGWMKVSPGETLELLSTPYSAQPHYVGFAIHDDQGVFGAVRFKIPTLASVAFQYANIELPVKRGGPWQYRRDSLAGLKKVPQGWYPMPFNFLLEPSDGQVLELNLSPHADAPVTPIGGSPEPREHQGNGSRLDRLLSQSLSSAFCYRSEGVLMAYPEFAAGVSENGSIYAEGLENRVDGKLTKRVNRSSIPVDQVSSVRIVPAQSGQRPRCVRLSLRCSGQEKCALREEEHGTWKSASISLYFDSLSTAEAFVKAIPSSPEVKRSSKAETLEGYIKFRKAFSKFGSKAGEAPESDRNSGGETPDEAMIDRNGSRLDALLNQHLSGAQCARGGALMRYPDNAAGVDQDGSIKALGLKNFVDARLTQQHKVDSIPVDKIAAIKLHEYSDDKHDDDIGQCYVVRLRCADEGMDCAKVEYLTGTTLKISDMSLYFDSPESANEVVAELSSFLGEDVKVDARFGLRDQLESKASAGSGEVSLLFDQKLYNLFGAAGSIVILIFGSLSFRRNKIRESTSPKRFFEGTSIVSHALFLLMSLFVFLGYFASAAMVALAFDVKDIFNPDELFENIVFIFLSVLMLFVFGLFLVLSEIRYKQKIKNLLFFLCVFLYAGSFFVVLWRLSDGPFFAPGFAFAVPWFFFLILPFLLTWVWRRLR